MIFVCDVCLDIHIITHVSRSEDNFRVSVLSLLIQVGCGIVRLCVSIFRHKAISLILFFYLFISQLLGDEQNPVPHAHCNDVRTSDIPKAMKPVNSGLKPPKL